MTAARGYELKASYFRQAIKNVEAALLPATEQSQLFDGDDPAPMALDESEAAA